jgi:hypothetical protein
MAPALGRSSRLKVIVDAIVLVRKFRRLKPAVSRGDDEFGIGTPSF